jgi:hypothetical protein
MKRSKNAVTLAIGDGANDVRSFNTLSRYILRDY